MEGTIESEKKLDAPRDQHQNENGEKTTRETIFSAFSGADRHIHK